MNGFILCSFSVGIDDLTLKEQAQCEPVLRVLQRSGRFSVFEATANQTIAKTITRLMKGGYLKSMGGAFPWTNVQLTEAGKRLIATPETPKG